MFENLSQFDGLNNIVHASKLPVNLAVDFTNIDTENYTIKSAKLPALTGISNLTNYFYKRPGHIIHSDTPLSVEYLNGYVYYTDKGASNTSLLKRINPDLSVDIVGTDAPTNEIILTQSGGYYREEGFYYAFFYYAITFYDPETGEESEPKLSSVIQAEEVVINVAFDAAEILDTTCTHLNIYRVGGMVEKFSLVESIDVSSYTEDALNDFSYADDKADTALTKLLTTRGTIAPPTGITNLIYHNGRFYASVGSRLRFSPFGNANRWDALSYIDFESNITGLASVNGMLLIFLETKSFVLYGTDTYEYKLLSLTGDIGCPESNSIAYFRNTVIWFTYNGLVCSDGNSVQYLTKDTFKFPDSVTVKDAITFRDKYYMLCTDGYMYELDMSNNVKFRRYYNYTAYTSFSIYEDNFWIINPTEEYVSTMFSGEEASIIYKSKLFIAPYYSFDIEVKKLTLAYNGIFDITFYDQDDRFIETYELDSSSVHAITDLELPANNNSFHGVYFTISGTGEIISMTMEVFYPETYNVQQQ